MASLSSPLALAATPLVLWLLAAAPAVLAEQTGQPAPAARAPLPGKPSDPPALRIPPDQPAGESANGDEVPAEEQPPGPRGAREKIRELLEGQDAPRETGDPILDGVLDLLRSRGSVLDDSTLDPRRTPEPLPEGGLWVPYIDGDGRPRREGYRPGGDRRGGGAAEDASRYLLAEQLLKTARMLAADPANDADRQRLIEDLRREAARCLAAEPVAPPDYGPAPAAHTDSY